MTRDPTHPPDEPLEPITDTERVRARRLSLLVDGLLAGAPPPAVLDAEDRKDLQAASLLRATLRPRRVLEGVFAPPRRRDGARGGLVFTVLAAAALVLLLLRSSRPPEQARLEARPDPITARELSRPADRLIGRIDPEKAAAARERMDTIYADRLAGYRTVVLRRGGAR